MYNVKTSRVVPGILVKHEVLHPVTELNADCLRDFSGCFIETVNKNLMGLTLPVMKQH